MSITEQIKFSLEKIFNLTYETKSFFNKNIENVKFFTYYKIDNYLELLKYIDDNDYEKIFEILNKISTIFSSHLYRLYDAELFEEYYTLRGLIIDFLKILYIFFDKLKNVVYISQLLKNINHICSDGAYNNYQKEFLQVSINSINEWIIKDQQYILNIIQILDFDIININLKFCNKLTQNNEIIISLIDFARQNKFEIILNYVKDKIISKYNIFLTESLIYFSKNEILDIINNNF